ncbi:MAG: hypothetical protein FWD34_01190 [Oscillospiraceae bacterium]|nr:hypothetical protein [Oscillospiraceae bacterium]
MSKNHKIDTRTEQDIRAQIALLASSYTPEWVFDPENPDIGSVIGLIFGGQLSDTIDKFNQLPEKYRTEFINMLNIGLLPAYPAQGVVVLELIRDTVSGVHTAAGTKLLGSSEGGETTVFETLSDLYVTNSRLTDIFSVSQEFGKIIPILGNAKKVPLLPGLSEAEPESIIEEHEFPRFKLFDFSGEGIEQNALIMYHPSVFDTDEDIALSIRIEPATGENKEALAEQLSDSESFRWSYYNGEKLTAFETVSHDNDVVILKRNGETGKIRLPISEEVQSDEMAVVCLEAVGKIAESVDFKSIQISSSCSNAQPSFISHNESEMDAEEFMPFGEKASIFDEFYIGHDRIFSQQGAFITLTFELNYREKLATFSPEQIEEQLKIIKRRPQQIVYDTANTCVERVFYEYFNGTGWKRLIFTQDWTTLFDGKTYGDITMSFICPDDWQPVTIGAATEKLIRVRVTQADNCYLQPCIHNMPVIKNLAMSYLYKGDWKQPMRLHAVRGTEKLDITDSLISGKSFTAFSPFPYDANAIYLGFDRKIEGSPFSLFFETEETSRFSGTKLRFEYSTIKGFSRLRTLDNTRGFSGSGIILFIPSSDFAQTEYMGEKRYWLRITDENGVYNDPLRYHPVIKRILPNAVAVHNVRTMDVEDFFVESAVADMSFPLAAKNILNAEVFVNEKGLSHTAKKELLETLAPEDMSIEYDTFGKILNFFVRWHEVENFDGSSASDRHYVLDRMTNSIQFGDGVNVRIPSASDDVAFTVKARCCDGAEANLPAGAVNSIMGNILYVDRVYNPVATFAGDNIESVEQAIDRGTNMLSSKNRLVSEQDFIREVKAFSGAVSQVKCVIDNKKPGLVSLAVLTHDYEKGSYSFDGLQERLRKRLIERSEATLIDENLQLNEPVFVKITVEVWIEAAAFGKKSGFETHSIIIEHIKRFIEPAQDISGKHRGRRIGELPTVHQIKVMLDAVQCDVNIRHFSATARYVDISGEREYDLAALEINPFMFCINGEHKIHILG